MSRLTEKNEMINFRRDDNMSIFLSFDHVGLAELLEGMKNTVSDIPVSIPVTFDKSVTTLKRTSPTETLNLIFNKGDETELFLEADDVVWRVTTEDLECALVRLKQCLSSGAFIPAEFIRVQIPKNNKLDYLFCEMINSDVSQTVLGKNFD